MNVTAFSNRRFHPIFRPPLTGTYQVTDIRIWEVANGPTEPGYLPAGQSLLGGLGGGNVFNQIDSGYTATPVTYNDGSTYQGVSENYWNIYQLDFSVNLTLKAGQTFDFFLNSPFVAGDTSGTTYYNAFLHASNAALSGSPQDGADNTFLWLDVNATGQTVETWDSATGAGTAGIAAGWNKSSDANVQVFGTAVPEANTMITGLLLLLPFGTSAFRILRKTRMA